jgi:hypothetical protein
VSGIYAQSNWVRRRPKHSPSTHLSGLNCPQGYVTKDNTAVFGTTMVTVFWHVCGLADAVDKLLVKRLFSI